MVHAVSPFVLLVTLSPLHSRTTGDSEKLQPQGVGCDCAVGDSRDNLYLLFAICDIRYRSPIPIKLDHLSQWEKTKSIWILIALTRWLYYSRSLTAIYVCLYFYVFVARADMGIIWLDATTSISPLVRHVFNDHAHHVPSHTNERPVGPHLWRTVAHSLHLISSILKHDEPHIQWITRSSSS